MKELFLLTIFVAAMIGSFLGTLFYHFIFDLDRRLSRLEAENALARKCLND